MTTSQRGIDLIKTFEGLSLKAIRLPGEQYYTIGYGHYGADVQPGQTMTKAQAEYLLKKDLVQFEKWVLQYTPFSVNQNQFDALVSFCYNCGPSNLRQLVSSRTPAQVANSMLAYTNSSSEAYRQGLYNRRKKEQALFLLPMDGDEDDVERWHKLEDIPAGYYRNEAERLVKAKIINGDNGDLDLTKDMLRTLLMAERVSKK